MLFLSEEILKGIREHGARGLSERDLRRDAGRGRRGEREVRALFPLVNRRDDSPRNRFSVTAEDVRGAERAAAQQGLELIGWYHSHPDHPARPSEFDREHAWPWYSYVIVSVAAGQPQDLTSWRLADDRSHFLPEEVTPRAGAPQRGARQ